MKLPIFEFSRFILFRNSSSTSFRWSYCLSFTFVNIVPMSNCKLLMNDTYNTNARIKLSNTSFAFFYKYTCSYSYSYCNVWSCNIDMFIMLSMCSYKFSSLIFFKFKMSLYLLAYARFWSYVTVLLNFYPRVNSLSTSCSYSWFSLMSRLY